MPETYALETAMSITSAASRDLRREKLQRQVYDLAVCQLKDAFRASWSDFARRRRDDPMSGFGKGYDWGTQFLKRYAPAWFERWFNHANWHPVLIPYDSPGHKNDDQFETWLSVTNAFYGNRETWPFLMRIFVLSYLEYHNVTLKQCEKPAVPAFFQYYTKVGVKRAELVVSGCRSYLLPLGRRAYIEELP